MTLLYCIYSDLNCSGYICDLPLVSVPALHKCIKGSNAPLTNKLHLQYVCMDQLCIWYFHKEGHQWMFWPYPPLRLGFCFVWYVAHTAWCKKHLSSLTQFFQSVYLQIYYILCFSCNKNLFWQFDTFYMYSPAVAYT